jgi:hypothetical protein
MRAFFLVSFPSASAIFFLGAIKNPPRELRAGLG